MIASPARLIPVAFVAALTLACSANAKDEAAGNGIPRSPSPAEASLYIVSPADGETVSSPFVVRFGLSGMGVAPAGVDRHATGHHHLVIDAPLPRMDQPIPATDQYRHFGGGQTEIEVELEPGEHTLQLLLGNHMHMPHDPPVHSPQITITVKD